MVSRHGAPDSILQSSLNNLLPRKYTAAAGLLIFLSSDAHYSVFEPRYFIVSMSPPVQNRCAVFCNKEAASTAGLKIYAGFAAVAVKPSHLPIKRNPSA